MPEMGGAILVSLGRLLVSLGRLLVPDLCREGRGMTKPGLSGNAFFVFIPGGSSLLELLNIESSLSVLAPVPDLFRERSSKVFG
jgi:hypothetical protein